MSQCVVPNWNQKQQRQVEGEERNRSPHVQSHQNLSYVVPMFNNEITELTWENGEIFLHGLLPKQTWDEGKPAVDSTLESLVHQATTFNFPSSQIEQNQDKNMHLVEQCPKEVNVNPPCGEKWRNRNSSDMLGKTSYGEEWRENLSSSSWGKRGRCESGEFHVEESACGSANAEFCRDTETTVMTRASFESPTRLKSARTADDDHDCSENQDREGATKEESYRSQSSARRSRAAATHNLSERRRRDRINQKMKTLQKLVPNASKTDKASMLDEVIEYLKQLQAQVQMMSNARSMPQMMMPMGMQQQLQMSLLASMGMGMGMLDVNNLTRNVPPHSFPPLIHTTTPVAGTTPAFVSPPFTMPPVVSSLTPIKPNVDVATVNSSVPNFTDTYNTFLAQQSTNMDFLNKMSALYRQQSSRQQRSASLSLPNDAQGRQ